jgi:hypothetical protein
MGNVNELDKELGELKGFVAELKADRAKQKETEKSESWTKYTSMSLVFIAVLAAVAAQWSGKYGGDVLVELNNSTYYQAQASDKWSYYQAKSIKQNLYEGLREAAPRDANNAAAAKSLEAFNAKAARYEAEKTPIMDDARKLEKQRDTSRDTATRANELGGRMGSAVSIYQIALALGSICLVAKKRPLWYLSLAIAAVATFKMAQVWFS